MRSYFAPPAQRRKAGGLREKVASNPPLEKEICLVERHFRAGALQIQTGAESVLKKLSLITVKFSSDQS